MAFTSGLVQWPAMLASPCTGVCAIERASGRCRGCRRTLDEIARWPDTSDAEKRAILARLPARRLNNP